MVCAALSQANIGDFSNLQKDLSGYKTLVQIECGAEEALVSFLNTMKKSIPVLTKNKDSSYWYERWQKELRIIAQPMHLK